MENFSELSINDYEYLENEEGLNNKILTSITVLTNIDKNFSFEDDVIDYLYKKYVRVATIQDGKSFLHCILKVMNEKYNSSTVSLRINMGNMLKKEIMDLVKVKKGEYFKTIYNLLKEDNEQNERAYYFLCDVLNINIIIYVFKNEKIVKYDVLSENAKWPTFHILKNKNNCFEPIGKISSGKLFFNFDLVE